MTTQKPHERRVGGSDPSRDDAKDSNDSEPPPTYRFTLIDYDDLAQEDSDLGLSPPEGYHLEGWRASSNAVIVCWESDDI